MIINSNFLQNIFKIVYGVYFKILIYIYKIDDKDLGKLKMRMDIIPGNHDIYVKKGVPKAMTKHLGDWMGKGSPSLFNLDGVSALHIETCCPDFLSRGWVDPNHLLEASELLHQVPNHQEFLRYQF